jgi:predicted RNase H-like HicB family nuclease
MATELPPLYLRRLEEQVAELSERLDRLEADGVTASSRAIVEIQTFAPEPYVLAAPIKIAIEGKAPGSFTASFFDANISTTGDTAQEAFENLESLILDMFDSLAGEAPENLGTEPLRQLATLREFVCPQQEE